MRVLLLHVGAPPRSRDLAVALAAAGHQVVLACAAAPEAVAAMGPLPGVTLAHWRPSRPPGDHAHRYLRHLEQAVLLGQGAVRLGHQLAAQGFEADLVHGDGGTGATFYAKELFPEATLVCAFATYARPAAAHGPLASPGDGAGVGADRGPAADAACLQRARNGAALLDLAQCDAGVVGSGWLRDRFPTEARPLLSVVPDGVDDTWFHPAPEGPDGVAARWGEVVTVAWARQGGADDAAAVAPALVELQRQRPRCQIVLVDTAGPRGTGAPTVGTWAAQGIDLARLRVVGPLGPAARRDVLQASSAYLHLGPLTSTAGVLEAMSCGCVVLGPDVGPLPEVVTPGEDGLLYPGSTAVADPAHPGKAAAQALAAREAGARLGEAARRTVLDRYRNDDAVARHVAVLEDASRGRAGRSPASALGGV